MHNKETSRLKRHSRIRMRLAGTPLKPRLAVHRSLKNLQAQVIDDENAKTLFSMSTQDKSLKLKCSYGGNIKASEAFGIEFAKRAQEKGIKEVVFDRSGYLYHGRVKSFADALRKGGLIF